MFVHQFWRRAVLTPMSKALTLAFLLLTVFCASTDDIRAAGNEWTWMKGDAWNRYAVYGTKGTEAPENFPGARDHAISWTDSSGNFWLFGGEGFVEFGVANPSGRLNDLWKFNPQTKNWTWMKGSKSPDSQGTHGPLGSEAPEYEPGAREGAVSWMDNEGNLWLYGGIGFWGGYFGNLNDMWKYNPVSNNWSKIEGTSPLNNDASYGTQYLEAEGNTPGARFMSMSWTDNSGNLWLFGGLKANGQLPSQNDMWKYNYTSEKWTWMKGSSQGYQSSIYGTKGTETSDSTPGGRTSSVTWKDTSGNFWLFGGGEMTTVSEGLLSDLWKFDTLSNNWTFIKGNSDLQRLGTYGTLGVEAPDNNPGARAYSVGWLDNAGDFWLFGGYGYGGYESGRLSDMWRYNHQTGNWTWMRGSKSIDRPPVYGTKEVAAPENDPGARVRAVGWKDNAGAFWLFGISNARNDLWRFQPLSSGIPWKQTLKY